MTDKHVVPEMFRQEAASRYRGRSNPSPISQMRTYLRMYINRKIMANVMAHNIDNIFTEAPPSDKEPDELDLFYVEFVNLYDEWQESNLPEDDLRKDLQAFLERTGFQ